MRRTPFLLAGAALSFAFTLALATTEARAETAVDVELCLAVDGSGSISDEEFRFQREGYAAALADPEVIDAIGRGYHRRIAVAHMEWGGPESQEPIVGWRAIDGAETAAAFGAELVTAPRAAWGWNSISNAILYCIEWMRTNEFEAPVKVIDVSGDAGQRGGVSLGEARAAAIAAGVTINALAINFRGGGMYGPAGEPLVEHYRRDVIEGFGSFAMAVESPDLFVRALVRKMVLEIAERAPAVRG